MEKNTTAEQPRMENSNFALCQRCSNNWRDECLVTRPQLVCSKTGIERCSHYFQVKTQPIGNKW